MTVKSKIAKQKELLLEQLRTIPIVEIACKRTGISRATFYRWCDDDEDFKTDVENSKVDGVENINDMSEAQLIGMIKEKKFQATALWLKHNHQRFMSEDKRNLAQKQRKSIELDSTKKALLKEALSHFK
jgi:hypothetical protein